MDSVAFDVVIVGGGVAGSALAVVMARAGAEVAVVERERRFRDRVRGDCLFPWGAAEMARLGIADALPRSGARPLPIWQSYEDRAPRPPFHWRDDVPTGDVVWGVDHPALQETLIHIAEEAGVKVLRPFKGGRPERKADSLHAVLLTGEGEPDRLMARLVVGADGIQSGARRWIGAQAVADAVHHMLGGCLLEGVDLDQDAAHVSNYEGGMSLLFRHGSGRVRGYVVCQPEAARGMRGREAAEAMLGVLRTAFPDRAFVRAHSVGPAAFFPGIAIASDRIAGKGIVLIGDAAGADDPAQGEGLSLAFRDVRALSGLLLEQDDWRGAIEAFAKRRPSWYEPLRAYSRWQGPLTTDVGPEADAARQRAKLAAEHDPLRKGYGAIQALGPDGLPVNEAARRHFLGLDPDTSAV